MSVYSGNGLIAINGAVSQEVTEKIAESYDVVEEKGGTIPAQKTAANLPAAIESIPTFDTGLYDSLSTIGFSNQYISELNAMRDEDINRSSLPGSISQDEPFYLPSTTITRTLQNKKIIIAEDITCNNSNLIGYFAECYHLLHIKSLTALSTTSIYATFRNTTSYRGKIVLNTPNVIDMSEAFHGSNVSEIEFIGNPKPTKMGYFARISGANMGQNLKRLNGLDTQNCTSFGYAFYYQYKLINGIQAISLKSAQNLRAMFMYCSSLTEVTFTDGDNATITDAVAAFSGCSSLVTVNGIIDVSNAGTNIVQMFQNDTNLVNIQIKGISRNTSDMFYNCNSLSYDSLLYIVQNLANVSGYTLTIGSTNIAKLTATQEGQDAIAAAQNIGWTLA